MNENVKSKLNKSKYVCPDKSYIDTTNWPLTGFDDCTCYWGYTKSGEGCVKQGTPTPTVASTPATPAPAPTAPVLTAPVSTPAPVSKPFVCVTISADTTWNVNNQCGTNATDAPGTSSPYCSNTTTIAQTAVMQFPNPWGEICSNTYPWNPWDAVVGNSPQRQTLTCGKSYTTEPEAQDNCPKIPRICSSVGKCKSYDSADPNFKDTPETLKAPPLKMLSISESTPSMNYPGGGNPLNLIKSRGYNISQWTPYYFPTLHQTDGISKLAKFCKGCSA
jgi:hypothetical protein